jgi:hypothetical protein
MNEIPKYDIFKEPEGYFNNLPQRIIHKKRLEDRKILFIRIASAAVLVIAAALFIFKQSEINENALQAEMDQEIELYINSGYWNAEDVLSFTEDPDELLDIIIAEEWSGYALDEDQIAEEMGY